MPGHGQTGEKRGNALTRKYTGIRNFEDAPRSVRFRRMAVSDDRKVREGKTQPQPHPRLPCGITPSKALHSYVSARLSQ